MTPQKFLGQDVYEAERIYGRDGRGRETRYDDSWGEGGVHVSHGPVIPQF
jgi:hypothetical protein